MIKANIKKHLLVFKQPSGTSRGVLKTKETWYLVLKEENHYGIGECGMFRGLSIDDRTDFEEKLQWVCGHIDIGEERLIQELYEFPSIQIGIETAFRSIAFEDAFQIFPSEFSQGNVAIPINGLVWMGNESFMRNQIEEKIKRGFSCLKLKIGAIDFQTELSLLKSIRSRYSSSEIELRVDANGAFEPSIALDKLNRLSEFELHSIEQPIPKGQPQEMARLCEESPIPIALDEELIGIFNFEEKQQLLQTIKPRYIILKPTLIGGFKASDEWIDLAAQNGCGWWITSALESNVGLNAISQYTFIKNSKLPQGLGTGELYVNNISSPLEVQDGSLYYRRDKSWDLSLLER